MPGFPLMAIGAGLGKFAEQYQQQQAQAERAMLLRAQLLNYARQAAAEGFKNEAAGGLANFDMSKLLGDGGTGIGPVGGGVGTPVAPTFDAARGSGGSFSVGSPAPQRAPLPPGVGGATRSAGDEWLRQNAPFPTQGRAGPQPDASTLPWTMNGPPASAYAELRGPGAPTPAGGPVVPPSAANMPPAEGAAPGVNFPVGAGAGRGAGAAPAGQGAPAQGAQPQDIAGVNLPEPKRVDWGTIVGEIRRQNPGMSNRAVQLFAEEVQKRMGENYKQEWEAWKTKVGFGYEGGRLLETQKGTAETQRSNLAREGAEQQRIGYEGQRVGLERERVDLTRTGQASEIEDRTIKQKHEAMRIADTQERTKIMKEVAEGKISKVQGEQRLAITQMKGLAERARDLYDAVEQNPNLVGSLGTLRRYQMSVTEQAKLGQYDKQLAEYRAAIKLFQAELQKPLLGSRYFTQGGLKEIQALVPSLEKFDSPTEVKAALRGLATRLEQKATETEAATGGVQRDYQGLSNEQLLQQLGVPQPGAQ